MFTTQNTNKTTRHQAKERAQKTVTSIKSSHIHRDRGGCYHGLKLIQRQCSVRGTLFQADAAEKLKAVLLNVFVQGSFSVNQLL